jgi:hypothetical protein
MSFRVSVPLKQAIVTANPAPLPSSQDTQILSNTNGVNSFSYSGYNFRGSNMFPENTVDISAFSYFDSTSGKFAGGVLAPNGKIYCIPHDANYVAIINPYTKTVDRTTIINVDGGITQGGKWYGGVLAPNGNIYCVPFSSSNIMKINIFTNTVSYITGITFANYPTIGSSNAQKWIGGVLAPNGKIYCSPYFAECALIIDTTNDTVNLTDISGVRATNPVYNRLLWKTDLFPESFGGAVLHPNGKVYFTACNANGVLQIDPTNNTIDASSYIYPPPFFLTGATNRFKAFGSCLGPDNNIYISPFGGSTRYFIKVDVTKDISNQQFTRVTPNIPDASLSTFQGVVCAFNGKMYSIPTSSTSVGIIDPITNSVDLTTMSNIPNLYSGGVLGPDGVIYCIPRNASRIMTIKTGIPSLQPWMLGSTFNKF